jgi:acyl-CoA synthetase (AMP-forming)/AMP-acid ligase II
MRHPPLGEDAAATVVLRDDATEADIRAVARERLADFEVPRRVLVLDALPKGATGKLQRVRLAKKLGLI